MTWIIIMVFALGISILALWRNNMLLAISSLGAWFGLLAYHLSYPPNNITQGSTADTIIILVIVGVGLAIPLIGLQRLRARRFAGGGGYSGNNEDSYYRQASETAKSPMDMSPEEYRAFIRRRVLRRRR